MGRTRQYKLNEHYFDKIDTEEKAYFLGMLFADGTNNGYRVKLSLVDSDKKLLNKLNNLIHKRPLAYQKGYKCKSQSTGKIYQGRPQYVLTILSYHVSKTLNNHGMVPRKSLILKFPKTVPKHLIHHFCRGYFDGDGHVSNKKRKENYSGRIYRCSVLGTKQFLTCFKKYAKLPDIKVSPSKGIYVLYFGGRHQTLTLLNWLYKNATIYLDRKYKVYQEIKTAPEHHRKTITYQGITTSKTNWSRYLNLPYKKFTYLLDSKKLSFANIFNRYKHQITRSIVPLERGG